MIMKLKLYLLIAAFFQTAVALGDTYTDPVNHVNYEYDKSKGTTASVKAGGWNYAGSPDATGDVGILESFTVDNIKYTVNEIGNSAFRDCVSITSMKIPEGINKIDDYAFYGCLGLTSIHIPASVVNINSSSFRGCDNLVSITVDEGNTVYDSRNGCNAIIAKNYIDFSKHKEYEDALLFGCRGTVIPEGVKRINDNAFYECKTIESIAIPYTVKSIGEFAFAYCKGLETVSILGNALDIENKAFLGCTGLQAVKVYDNLECWFGMVFMSEESNPLRYAHTLYFNDVEVKDLVVPQGVQEVKRFAFYGSDINSVTFSSSVKTIRGDAFVLCSGLRTVTIPYGVETLNLKAFQNLKLRSVSLPTSIKEMQLGFYGCTIDSVYISDVSWLLSLQYSPDVLHNANHLIVNGEELHDLVVPSGSMMNAAFSGFKGLYSVSINSKYVAAEAFCDCKELTSVTFGDNVNEIRTKAFQGCTKLKSVVIPSSIETIGLYAFYATGIYNSQPDGAYYVDNWAGGYKGDNLTDGEFVVREGTIGIAEVPNVSYVSIPASVEHISNVGVLKNLKNLYVDG